MTEERWSGLGKLLIHGGTDYIPEPRVIYQMKQKWPHIGSQPCQEPVEVGTHERTSPCNSRGEGGYLTKFIMGRLRPEVQHLALFYTILAMGS